MVLEYYVMNSCHRGDDMTLKMRYVAPTVMGLVSAIAFVNVTMFLISNPSTATLWDQAIVECAIFGMVFFAIAMWICISAIAKGRRMS